MTNNIAENSEVARFLKEHEQDMPEIYKTYDWEGDIWKKDFGFPKLFELEREISKAAKAYALDKKHLMMIAIWGKLRNRKRIERIEKFKITLYINDEPAFWLTDEPENIISIVVCRIPGFGPTFSSKLLHFAVPQVFGILDTWLVRTFGEGDLDSQCYKFLNLKATEQRDGGWAIPTTQPTWPDEYGTWIRILNYLAEKLNTDKIPCPHPLNYIEAGLRKDGIWYPADVETALFSYAYEGRGVKKKMNHH